MSFRVLCLVLVLAGPLFVSGQFFNRLDWRDQRHQLEWGVGASNFLGDLGGKDGIGTNDLKDLEWVETNAAVFVGYKYTLYRKWFLRTDFNYGRVSGDDKLTKEPFRNNRNLSFRSNLWELDLMLEYEIPINSKRGHIYNIKGAKGWKNGRSSFLLAAGVGVLKFNPQTLHNDRWIDLRPLRTEGQGLPGGVDEYKLWQLVIPAEISLVKRVSNRISLGLTLAYRWTFTDYIDDVSSNYYDPSNYHLYLNNSNDIVLATYLSNPNLGGARGGLDNYVTSPGQQRGDIKDNDGYMYGFLRFSYLLETQQRRFKKHRIGYKPKRTPRRF